MSSNTEKAQILTIAKKVLAIEERSLRAVHDRLDEEFYRAVRIIEDCRGRVVFTGMGKSGHVCRKIVATFASTGTPALFLHPAEGGHGDLGMLMKGDVLIAVSNSGETAEMVRLLPAIKRLGVPIICMTGKTRSTMAKRADVVLDISVMEEACPLGLAPTASTAVTMALGDAMAVTLLEIRGFTEEDFVLFHPGGTIGKRLLTVSDIMHTGEEIPRVSPRTQMREALFEITSKKLGFTTVIHDDGSLLGIITDGDLRRLMERESDPLSCMAGEVMIKNPKVVSPDALAAKALQIMEAHAITNLVVLDEENRIRGVLHMHDILKAGIA
jgi:arabinose-5-phosphate isomerase